jgi:hypothetical protein
MAPLDQPAPDAMGCTPSHPASLLAHMKIFAPGQTEGPLFQ